MMSKEGHIGIVKNTSKPIAKGVAPIPVFVDNETLINSTSHKDATRYNHNESFQDYSAIGY